jgi:Mg-chelatase subunit ChlD
MPPTLQEQPLPAPRRSWAFWRRTQYAAALFIVLALIGTGIYFAYFHQGPTCFDGLQNGAERGIDCGGACTRICALDIAPPTVLWAKAFRVVDGQYNAEAYVQNTNAGIGSPNISYTFTLSDAAGVIATRSGTTVLPPDSTYPIFEGRITTGTRVPTETTLTLGTNATWLPASAGREQFVVESRTLTGVGSTPRLDAKITNTALTEADNVEVVATIFDSKRNPLTASKTLVERFAPRTTEDVVFTWPQPIATTLRSCEVPTDVILAIDLSGSMDDDGGDPPQPVSSVVQAAGSFVSRLKPADRIGVVTYATKASLVRQLTSDSAAAASTVSALSIAQSEERGSTNTGDALKAAEQELDSDRHNPDARKVLVLLTDGLANAPGDDAEQYALDAADALRQTDVDVFTIGLGNSVNDAFLSAVASAPDHYLKAPTAASIDQIYRSVTEAICEDGPATIEIIPKTSTNFASSGQ